MSLISHLIDELKRHAEAYETGEQEGAVTAISTAKVLREAAWTIEQQGMKIRESNHTGGWIPAEQSLPEKTGRYRTIMNFGKESVNYIRTCHYDAERKTWRPEIIDVDDIHDGFRIIAWKSYPERGKE